MNFWHPHPLPTKTAPPIFSGRFFGMAGFAKCLQVFHYIFAAIRQRNDVITLGILRKHHTTTLPALILVTQQYRFA